MSEGIDQIEQIAQQSGQYKQGIDKEDAWKEIEDLSKVVHDGKVFDKDGFRGKTVEAQDALQKLNLAAVEDFENKNKIVQKLYEVGAYFGVVSSYKTADKIEKEIIQTAVTLERIAEECYNERDNPRNGIMASLEQSEIKRESGYELKDLSTEMRTDQELELSELKKMYKEKEYGSGKRFESSIDLKRQIRATSKEQNNLDRMIKRTNLEILSANNEVQGKKQIVGVYDAFTTLIEAEAMKLRAAAINFRYNPKIAKRVGEAMQTLGGNLGELIGKYNTINDKINMGVDGIIQGIGNIEGVIDYDSNGQNLKSYDATSGMTKKADKISLKFDDAVEKLRVNLEEEELVF